MKKPTLLMRGICAVGVASVLHAASVAQAQPQPYVLTDLNTTVGIVPSSQVGIHQWDVNGVSHLDQQWFWYRVGPTVAGTAGGESSLDTLQSVVNSFTPTGPLNGLNMTYSGSGFIVDLDISITGGTTVGTQVSSISEQITITNTSGSPLDLSFFQYVNMTLGGTPSDSLSFDPTIGAPSNIASFTDGPLSVAEVVATTKPTAYQGDLSFNIFNSLTDNTATNLNNTPTVGNAIVGNVEMAFQWDFHLTASGSGSSAQISKVKTLDVAVIPVPGAVWLGLVMLGLMGAARGVRQRVMKGTG